MSRHFYKCFACLDVFAVDCETKRNGYGGRVFNTYPAIRTESCDCGGKVSYMGEVRQDRLQRQELRCACDSRCTDATGPNCDCSCGGANHGTHRTVTVTIDNGSAKVAPRADLETRRQRAQEFEAAKTAAKQRIDAATNGALTAAAKGEWLPRATWEKKQDLVAQYIKAKKYLNHKRRITALGAIAT